MTTLGPPDFTQYTWVCRKAQNNVRVVLLKCHNLYYTSLEVPPEGDGQWEHVKGSSVGHGIELTAAEERVARLLNGEWGDLLPPV